MKGTLALLVFAVLLFGQAYEIVGTLKDAHVRWQIGVASPEKLTLSAAMQASNQFLSESPRPAIGILLIYGDKQSPAGEMLFCENNYEQWRSRRRGFSDASLHAAYLISISTGAVLWVRSPNGTIDRRVLFGEDPTEIRIDDINLKILFVATRTRSKFESCRVGAIEPELFIRMQLPVTQLRCERAITALSKKMPSEHISASFRNDEGFLCSRFPVFYPFSDVTHELTQTEYRHNPEFTCSISCDGKPHCVQTLGEPAN